MFYLFEKEVLKNDNLDRFKERNIHVLIILRRIYS